MSVNSIDAILHMTSTTLESWTNSTIHLMWEPEIIKSLRCEGKNQYGVHASGIFLIPGEWREVQYDWVEGVYFTLYVHITLLH